MKHLIIIPAHNEAATLRPLINEVRAFQANFDILVIDDASRDQTSSILSDMRVRSIRLYRRGGVGDAIRCGLAYAAAHHYQMVVRIDADGQHLPANIGLLELAYERCAADAVVGSRYLVPSNYQTPPVRRLVQKTLSAALSARVADKITDPTSGFWLFGPRAISLLVHAHPSGYAEPILQLVLRRQQLRVVEVGVSMRPRLGGKSTLAPIPAGFAVARAFARIASAGYIAPAPVELRRGP